MAHVLIVEDSDDLLFSLSNTVRKEGYSVYSAPTGAEALAILNNSIVDLVFLDIGLPDIDGIELISRIREIGADIEIVMLTGKNDAKTAVHALKAGAVDYILKPFDLIEFKQILHRIMRGRLALKKELVEPKEASITSIIGVSTAAQRLRKEIETAAAVKAPVLISGETGTGKELVARALHSLIKESKRRIFVKVDCGALAANVIESELFGHEKGAFTDANREKKGLAEMANGGTLFLDEIGNLPLSLQPVLLRMIEEKTFRRVGGLRDIKIDVRVIAATNINIEKEIAEGRFREDLYYRLNVIEIAIPPLRERDDDVLLIAEFFLRMFSRDMKKNIKGFTPEAEKNLLDNRWPGNIRELKNCIERGVIYCTSEWLAPQHMSLEDHVMRRTPDNSTFVTLKEMEKEYIRKVLESTGNNKSEAARILDISRTTLRDKLS